MSMDCGEFPICCRLPLSRSPGYTRFLLARTNTHTHLLLLLLLENVGAVYPQLFTSASWHCEFVSLSRHVRFARDTNTF